MKSRHAFFLLFFGKNCTAVAFLQENFIGLVERVVTFDGFARDGGVWISFDWCEGEFFFLTKDIERK